MLKRLLAAAIPLIAVLVVPVGLIAGIARTASAADTTAGTCGSVVIITPSANGTGGINTSPGINGAPGINTAPGLNGSPAAPQGAMILTPTRGTGTLVVPVPAAAPAALAGPEASRYQVIVPGPNPAQNTSVALSQLLSTLLSPPGGITPVAVYPVPGSPPYSTP